MPRLAVIAVGGLLVLTAGCASSSPHDVQAGSGDSASVVAIRTSTPSSGAATRPGATSSAPSSSAAASATPSPSRPAAATQRVVLRPVTGHGTVAPGYTLSKHLGDEVSCSGPARSPVAVDANIAECGPTALYPVACWAGATPRTALCYRNPFAKQVDLLTAPTAPPAVTAPGTASPFGLVLSDGATCTFRIGGAWAELDGHPNLYGTYGCSNKMDVWGGTNSDGINRAGARWTLQLAPDTGHGALHTATVATAYFVGTAR